MKTKLSVLGIVLACVFLLAAPAMAQSPIPPRPNGFVYDEIGAFTPDQKALIENQGDLLLKRTGIALVFATVNNCGDKASEFGPLVFNSWGIGSSGSNRGFLGMMCWNNGEKATDKRAFVTVPGKGLEAEWSKDARSRITQLYLAPVFAQDKYSAKILSDGDLGTALVKTYQEYANRMGINNTPAASPPAATVQTPASDTWTLLGLTMPWWLWVIVLIVVVVVVLVVIGSIVSASADSTDDDDDSYRPMRDGGNDFLTGYTLGSMSQHSSSHHDSSPAWSPPSSPSPSPFDSGSSSFGSGDSSSFSSSPFDGGSSSPSSSGSDSL